MKTFLWHVEWITARKHHPSEKFGLPLHTAKCCQFARDDTNSSLLGFKRLTSRRTHPVELRLSDYWKHTFQVTNLYIQVQTSILYLQQLEMTRLLAIQAIQKLAYRPFHSSQIRPDKKLFILWAWRGIFLHGVLFNRRLGCILHSGIVMSSSKSCSR